MIYGQDSPIAFPVADLYDTGVMQMYLNAVRDQYQQGLKDYENFISKYGDFTSPFAKDVDRWNNEVMGPTMNLIDALYAQGIDPMRNAEARAMIQRSVRSVPYAEAAKMKQNAAAGEAYLKARGALAAKGLYDKDYNDFWLAEQGYKPFEEWSSEDGIWNVTSPIEYKSLFDATSPWFEKMQKHDLTKEQVLAAKYPYDPKYRYTGIPIEDLQEVTGRSLPGFMNSFEGRYYRKTVADRLAAAGIEPTDEAVNEALANDIVTANHRVVVDPIADADEYALADYKAKLEEEQAVRNHARQLELYDIRYGDDGDGGSGRSSRSKSGSGGGKQSDSDSMILSEWDEGLAHILRTSGKPIYNTNDIYSNAWNVTNAQVGIFNRLTNNGKDVKVTPVINTISRQTSSSVFPSFMNRAPLSQTSNIVRYNYGDLDRVVTSDWIVNNMKGNPSLGRIAKKSNLQLSTPFADNAKSEKIGVPKEGNIVEVQMVDGKKNIISVVLNDNKIHQFAKVRFKYVSRPADENSDDKRLHKPGYNWTDEYWMPIGPVSEEGSYAISPESRYQYQLSDANAVKRFGGGMKGNGTATDFNAETRLGFTQGYTVDNVNADVLIPKMDPTTNFQVSTKYPLKSFK